MILQHWLILRRKSLAASGMLVLLLLFPVSCRNITGGTSGGDAGVQVVAAENFYGDIAKQLGGPAVKVSSIISDPNADPHEYESSSDNAKAVARARLVIVNGIGYDEFMDKLLGASPNKERGVINAGDLSGKRDGDNPHIWYEIAVISRWPTRLRPTSKRSSLRTEMILRCVTSASRRRCSLYWTALAR